MPLISILMPVFNGEKFLSNAIDSILAQTLKNFELIISDNHSTDSTRSICLSYAKRDSRITYLRNRENLGVFRNVELLTMQAKGEFLMWVGDDDIYEPECLALLYEKFKQSEGLVLVFSDYEWITSDGKKNKSNMKPCHFMSGGDEVEENILKFLRYSSVLPIIMGMIRTSVCQQSLPFPNYKKGYESFTGGRDLCFLWKILTSGKVDSIRRPLFYYRIKNRANSIPSSWGENIIYIKLRILYVNWIILKDHAIPNIWKSNINLYKKIKLISFAVAFFCVRSFLANT